MTKRTTARRSAEAGAREIRPTWRDYLAAMINGIDLVWM